MQIFKPTFFASALLALTGYSLTTTPAEALNSGLKLYGLNYNSRKGPDWDPDSTKCKTTAEVLSDMQAIKAITDRVRIYSLVDCDLAKQILPAAKTAGLQVTLGIWTTSSAAYLETEKAKLGELIDAGLVDSNVLSVIVGSESVYRGDITADTAVSYMQTIKNYLTTRGITNIPVSIADTIDSYNQYSQLVDAVDYVAVNQFSFWEAADVNEGAAGMLDRLKDLRVKAAAKNKEVLISETGWSSSGSASAAGVASLANQAKYFNDFYLVAQAHDFKYYWFTAFDAQWRVAAGETEIEANFGIYKEDRTMKSNFQSLTVPTRSAKSIRNAGSALYLSENDGEVYMSATSDDWLVQEQQVWFFDATTSQVRSKSSDRCLDAYEAWDGGKVHVYRCIDSEVNQKWSYDSATGKLAHAGHVGFCLDTDPAQNNKLQLYGCSPDNKNQQWVVVDPSSGAVTDGSVRFFTMESTTKFAQLVRSGDDVVVGFGASGVEGSEWFYDASTHLVQSKGSNYCLDAYQAWDGGDIHVWTCDSTNANQLWNFDTSTNQFKHLTHSGFCLDADLSANNGNGVIQLYGCHLNNNNQVWRKVSTNSVGVTIHGASVSDSYLEPNTSQDTVVGQAQSSKDPQYWFYDASAQKIISKYYNQCLDGYEPKEGGRVHTYACIDTEVNQKWTYNAATQQVQHATYTSYCLAFTSSTNKVMVLKACNVADATQLIRIESA